MPLRIDLAHKSLRIQGLPIENQVNTIQPMMWIKSAALSRREGLHVIKLEEQEMGIQSILVSLDPLSDPTSLLRRASEAANALTA